jgi:hypothetical protein
MLSDIYSKSNYYRKIKKLLNNDGNSIKIFMSELNNKKFIESDVLNFLKNYENIDYTSERIIYYEKLLNYFEYDIEHDFIFHISRLWTFICKSEVVINFYNYENYKLHMQQNFINKNKQLNEEYQLIKQNFINKNKQLDEEYRLNKEKFINKNK